MKIFPYSLLRSMKAIDLRSSRSKIVVSDVGARLETSERGETQGIIHERNLCTQS